MSRRLFLKSVLATSAALSEVSLAAGATLNTAQMRRRAIPKSGELLPVVGLGTWQTFDVGESQQERAELRKVLELLVESGGSVIDSSPMYGRSESVVGELARQAGLIDKLFMATKVWTTGKESGIQQMDRSLSRMQKSTMDLMQVHNLQDAERHLDTLSDWKQEGRVRYVGITHYHSGGYSEMVRLMQAYPLDFIQINYAIDSRDAEQEVLPLAAEKKVAVLINRPYSGGQLFSRVRGKELPSWAGEFDCTSWGQFFLKFVLANEAVTCVIPGTSKTKHLRDNLQAGFGALPNAEQRAAMLAYLNLD